MEIQHKQVLLVLGCVASSGCMADLKNLYSKKVLPCIFFEHHPLAPRATLDQRGGRNWYTMSPAGFCSAKAW